MVNPFRSIHRYHCNDSACGWEGLLGPDGGDASRGARWRAVAIWGAIGVACAAAAVQGVRVYRESEVAGERLRGAVQRAGEARARAVAAGEDFAGVPLSPGDDRIVANPSPLQLRRGCAWGVPGGDPYRGTVEQALAAARLPPEVVERIADMANRGWVFDQVEISREGIRTIGGDREFGSSIRAMAFGDRLCFDTQVNFRPGHVEYAALYQVDDDKGKTYTVMVPYVCRNVSVLGEREGGGNGNGVPEPSTWTMVLLGVGLLTVLRRRRRGGSP